MDTGGAVEEVFTLFDEHGDGDYIGECVSKTSHSIQCAMLAEKDGCPPEIVLGALLHDVGHLVGERRNMEKMTGNGNQLLGTKDHETVGANFLKNLGFPSVICDLVGGHVNAKRYLTWKHPEYYENLTTASRQTLEHQGGRMSDQEAAEFEASDLFDVIIKLRRWDEQAKDVNCKTEPLEKYKKMCINYLSGNT